MKKPDFGPMFIESPNGCLIENPQRERNAISYLLDILEVKKRGEYITGIDGGPGMDTLEGAAFRIAKLVEQLQRDRNSNSPYWIGYHNAERDIIIETRK